MPLYVDGATFSSNNNGIAITANSVTGFNVNGSGFQESKKNPSFMAKGTTASWTLLSSGSWNYMTALNEVVFDTQSNFNTDNGRFTAPTDGIYMFWHVSYCYKNYSPYTNSWYVHPGVFVNGSSTARKASISNDYALTMRRYNSLANLDDNHGQNILRLSSGDYVNFVLYASGSMSYYPNYTYFGGCLLG